MEKGCGWEDSGSRGAEEANAPQRSLKTWDSTLPVFAAALEASWQPRSWFPFCLILGGVEQPDLVFTTALRGNVVIHSLLEEIIE